MRSWILGVLVLACACGDDSEVRDATTDATTDAGADGSTDDAADAFVPPDAGPTVTWDVRVRDLLTGDPVLTANICVRDVPAIPCLQVDETTGEGQIEVPVNAEIQLVSNAIRYFPQLNTYVTDTSPRSIRIDMGKTSNITPLIASAGVTVDETKAQVAFLAQDEAGSGLAGVTASLDPSSGMGPFYTNGSLPDPELSATSNDGLGVFTNVEPGAVEIVYDNPNGSCVPEEGWPGRGSNRVGTSVLGGHLSFIIARCSVDAADATMDAGVAADTGTDGGG